MSPTLEMGDAMRRGERPLRIGDVWRSAAAETGDDARACRALYVHAMAHAGEPVRSRRHPGGLPYAECPWCGARLAGDWLLTTRRSGPVAAAIGLGKAG